MTPTITNKYGLPEALVRAVTNDPYTGGGDISVTKLIDSPQRRTLLKTHEHEIEEDVSERIWSLLGQAVHHILERAGMDEGDVVRVEERLFATMDGWSISGQFDRLNVTTRTLQDWKLTTTFKAKGDAGWIRQLNVLRWLAAQNGLLVDRLEIVAIFRDFKKSEVYRNPDYPTLNVKVIPVPTWPMDETEEYVKTRIKLHQVAQTGYAEVWCTDEERWYTGDKWALMKPGGKRALRVLDEQPSDVPEGLVVEHRPGIYRRCEQYCEVAKWCPQWQQDDPFTQHPRVSPLSSTEE